jgi:hypothetical protein
MNYWSLVRLDDRGSILVKAWIFSLCVRVQTGSDYHAVSQPMVIGGSFPGGVKRPGREDDHPSPFSAEVKNEWSCNSTTQHVFFAWCLIIWYGFMAWYLAEHRDNFPNMSQKSYRFFVLLVRHQDASGKILKSCRGTSILSNGYRGLLPEIKRPEHEADH